MHCSTVALVKSFSLLFPTFPALSTILRCKFRLIFDLLIMADFPGRTSNRLSSSDLPKDPFKGFSLLEQLTMWWARQYRVPPSQATLAFVKVQSPALDVEYWADLLSKAWTEEQEKSGASFYRVVKRVFWRKYFRYLFPFLLMACGQLGIAVVLCSLVRSLADSSESNAACYVLAAVYSVATWLSVSMVNQGFLRGMVLGSAIRAAVSLVLYEKALTLNSRSLSQSSAKLVNFLSTGMDMLDMLPSTMFLLVTPFFVVISTPVLWWLAGPAGLVAEATVLLIAPAKWYMSKWVAKLKKNTTELTETRIKYTQSLIEDIKSIKMYCLEPQLLIQIQALKAQEHRENLHMNKLHNFTSTFVISGGLVVILVLLVMQTALGEDRSAATVFAAMSILFTMNSWVNAHMSWGLVVSSWLQQLMRNVTDYMRLPPDCEERTFLPNSSSVDVSCQGVSATWDSSHTNVADSDLVLKDLNVEIPQGQVCMVIGNVGSGKSSFLSVLAGVLKCTAGSVQIRQSIAYVPNEPWIIAGTVKDNITMGEYLLESIYEKTVKMCGLEPDLQQLAQGDMTLIGDKGSTLSGGQKTRIALARAVYSNQEVYLLDDPLSAVDAHVSAHIFHNCIVQGLRGKTRILVTSQHFLLPQADLILVFRNGRLLCSGKYEDLKTSEVCRAELTESFSASSPFPLERPIEQKMAVNCAEKIAGEQEIAAVPLSVYLWYFHLCFKSVWAKLGLLLVMICVHGLYLGSSYWVSYWTSQSESEQQERLYPSVLACLVAAVILTCILRNTWLMGGMARANLALHNQALEGVTHTETAFFDTNSVGSILSRFTKDCWVMDDLFIKFCSDLLISAFFLLGYAVAMAATLQENLPGLVLLLVLTGRTVLRYAPSARQFKRLELDLKGTTVELVTSTISGLNTIRSLNYVKSFRSQFSRQMSLYFTTAFCYYGNIQTFQAIMEALGVLFVSMNALFSVALRDSLSPSVAAVNFSFAVMINITMGAFTTFYVHTGSFMLSGFRLYAYTQLPRENDEYSEFPLRITKGDIEFKAVSLRYGANLPLALHRISFQVPGGSKVGLIGRTGSGKSSIMQVLFRLREICSGTILIDRQDISEVGLESLRSQLNNIPQSPLLFQGNVFDNLASFGSYSQTEIEAVLYDFNLDARGAASELSTGQRQLLCLARAFLRHTQIVLFDEPTGNIDPNTQDFVMRQMKKRFAAQTVVVIAHRLQTVMECDTVLVLEDGSVVEAGSPAVLAQTEGSRFQSLLKTSGLST